MAKRAKKWTQTEIPSAGLDAFLGDVVPSAETRVATTKRLHAQQGKAANRSGRENESWFEVHHRRALTNTPRIAARIWHVGAPWVPHIVRGKPQYDRRQRLLGAIIDIAPPDYMGLLTDGIFFAAEAKRRTGRLYRDRWRAQEDDEGNPTGPLVEDRDAIEEHQARDLTIISTTRAVALVLVTFVRVRKGTDYEIRVAAPWSVLAGRWRSPRGGALSVGPEDLEDYRVTGDCYLERFVR